MQKNYHLQKCGTLFNFKIEIVGFAWIFELL